MRWLELALAVLLAWVAAGLFWQLAGSRSDAVRLAPPATPPKAAEVAWGSAINWFGASESTQAQASSLPAQLIAVIAGNDQSSVAIFSGVQASSVAVRVGEELQSGVRLVKVARDHVEIERNGARESLLLPQPTASGMSSLAPPSSANGLAAGARPPVGAAMPPDAPPIMLARGQLAAVLTTGNIADWAKGLSVVKDGGLQIDDVAQQPFARAIQLQNGDIIKNINDRPVTLLSDISVLYSVFSQQNQVALVVQRHDGTLRLRYQIQP
ncbi:type II secretion system protein N [Andreprevotia chitinilytica]|uniref:type II secretion system protein N n=1 Tax=Andreprevotia chitinilytica TaxID=396808 RepID=UPI000690C9CC|nr:type II secretion system protein N [Andreprevotia chitinilytica]